MPAPEKASLLTIPCELRNAIYCYIFLPDPNTTGPLPSNKDGAANSITTALYLSRSESSPQTHQPNQLRLLQTCKQIHNEAHLLALSTTTFHLSGETSYPTCFSTLIAPLPSAKIVALRHLSLRTRISSLRALNETWSGAPFGDWTLQLDTLTIIPTRADSSRTCYQEVADLSQSHTLAYIFAETLKGLRNVRGFGGWCIGVLFIGCGGGVGGGVG
ncbi:hypothetical protein LTR37_019710 [Vermiconidia calcicola]|uniref:Uncharacterized protein n=1 Tax=Vermiconidia calcicola TaxID=1690605 RepID=A0ACC3MF93_9PEZI|nr:hypothetical protein LTR37_019710 [Vermiconidia calcicola]